MLRGYSNEYWGLYDWPLDARWEHNKRDRGKREDDYFTILFFPSLKDIKSLCFFYVILHKRQFQQSLILFKSNSYIRNSFLWSFHHFFFRAISSSSIALYSSSIKMFSSLSFRHFLLQIILFIWFWGKLNHFWFSTVTFYSCWTFALIQLIL